MHGILFFKGFIIQPQSSFLIHTTVCGCYQWYENSSSTGVQLNGYLLAYVSEYYYILYIFRMRIGEYIRIKQGDNACTCLVYTIASGP